ncbi:uncharacterized protein DUF4102 [Shimia isoporae]|uniref:Uncharacterized protein DUF4102 n=1 Tax=Shimia isoporae TaxID=647720 RepID=A0A4R1N0X7_9RHOB|nr:Arm DNA-binding domain-containing protein [Shimia isoporae]TCK99354.1 uncharacterized protein DUF4102 [Shimia isoporae]
MKLTEEVIKDLKPNTGKPQKVVADDDAKYLFIVVGNTKKTWQIRCRSQKAQIQWNIGYWPEMSLQEARSYARLVDRQIERGVDPRETGDPHEWAGEIGLPEGKERIQVASPFVDGLSLQVTTKSKSWQFRYRSEGSSKLQTIGKWPQVSVARAVAIATSLNRRYRLSKVADPVQEALETFVDLLNIDRTAPDFLTRLAEHGDTLKAVYEAQAMLAGPDWQPPIKPKMQQLANPDPLNPWRVYYARILSKEHGGPFYKVGVSKRDIKNRLTERENTVTEVACAYFPDKESAKLVEQQILKEFEDLRGLTPRIFPTSGGNTEVFPFDILGLDSEPEATT